jgi:hypothetical protein
VGFYPEIAAGEMRQLTLADALQLLLLCAEVGAGKFERAALRWHSPFVVEACR